MKNLSALALLLFCLQSFAVTKEEYDQVMAKLESIYVPFFKKQKINFSIQRRYLEGSVNGTSMQKRKNWSIVVYGGYAYRGDKDAVAMLACHEIGHLIGAVQHYFKDSKDWAANEGEADYFATLKCLREYFADEDNLVAIEKLEVPSPLRLACEEVWKDSKAAALCIRSSLAGISMVKIFSNNQIPVAFDTPDPNIVAITSYKHPAPQCRLDSIFQGALCSVDKNVLTSKKNPAIGTCTSATHTIGLRPACWYRE